MHLYLLVAVLVYAPGGAKRAEVQAALEKAAGEVDLHALRAAIAERTAGWVRAEELGFFERARAKAEEGRRLLDRVELEAADSAFAEAEHSYEAALAWPGVPTLWSHVALWRGVAAFQRGQPQLARRLFQRAAALDGTARLTEATARPDVVRAFTEATRPRPKVALVVKSPGEVLVDGQAPPAEVTAGEHVVVARLPGHVPAAVLVDAQSALEVELHPSADPVLEALESLKRAPSSAGLRALAAARGLDAIFVAAAGLDAGELTLVGERADAGGCSSTLSTVVLRGAALEVAASSLMERLQRAQPRCPAAPEAILAAPPIAHPRPTPVAVTPLTLPPRKKKVWERPWIWMGLLAASVVGIGLAAGLATTDVSYKATVDGGKFATPSP